MPDYYKEVDTDIIENFYRGGIINRKEYREVRIKPNKIFNILQQNFREQLNLCKINTSKNIELSGFLHSPPEHILRVFNKCYPALRENFGYYELLMISSTPTQIVDTWPVIIPITQADTKKYIHTHFIKINGRILNLSMFDINISQLFLHATHIDVLGYDDIFQITPPSINTDDVYEMLRDHFTVGGCTLNTILLSIFSSPIYEGRAGGNALSLTSSSDSKYGCSQKIMTQINKDLHMALGASFKQKRITQKNKHPSYIQHFIKARDTQPLIQYKFNVSTNTSIDFLKERKTYTQPNQEINISTHPTRLDTSFLSRPIKENVYKPTQEMQILKYTDLPLLLIHHDVVINPIEKELCTYASDIQHLIHSSRLHVPRTQINRDTREKIVKNILYQLEKEWPQIAQLTQQGIIFDIGLIGGIGEHITRLIHAIMRANKQNTIELATHKAEQLYYDVLTKVCAEIETPATRLAATIDKEGYGLGSERKTGLKTAVDSTLFNLEGLYPEGWDVDVFVEEMKKRGGAGQAQINRYFEEIKQLGWVKETSPGLYKLIPGIDRAFL